MTVDCITVLRPYICCYCGHECIGVVLRDEVGHSHPGCHPFSNRGCSHCDDELLPEEAVEWDGKLWHHDCVTEVRAWICRCVDSDRRSYVSAIGSGQR